MADRYTLFEIEQLRDRFSLPGGVPMGVKRTYNMSPAQLGSVIVNRDGVPTLERMKWGLVPTGAKNDNSVFRYKTYLIKSEGVFAKSGLRQTRCLVPANGYYEWRQTPDGKRPFYIRPTDQSLFAFAGVYASWQDPAGVTWGTYSIITAMHDRSPKQDLRRPIILHPGDEAAWLDPAIDDMSTLYGLMRPYTEDMLTIHQVATDLKNSKRNDPQLLDPIA